MKQEERCSCGDGCRDVSLLKELREVGLLKNKSFVVQGLEPVNIVLQQFSAGKA